MANLNGFVLTSAGKNLFAKSSSGGCKVVFTKAKLGEDETTIDEMLTKSDLVGTNMKTMDIVSSKAEENKFTIITTITNTDQEKHFYIRQLGVFAKGVSTDGLETEVVSEALIAVAYDTNPDVIPAASNNATYAREIDINFSINNADDCEITISLGGVVTVETLENELEKYLPLSGGIMTGLLSLFTGSTIPTPDADDNSQKIVNSEWVQSFIQKFVDALSEKLEVEWSDSTFTVPALGVTGLMAQNGYICLGKLFGGLILQWGFINEGSKNSYYDITYPIAFTDNVYNITPVDIYNTTGTEGSNSPISVIYNKITLTSCRVAIGENYTIGYAYCFFIGK